MPYIEFISPPSGPSFDPYIQSLGFTAGAPDVQGALKSIDGGLAWTSHTSPITGIPAGRLIAGATKLIGAKDRTPTGVWRSTDGGVNWTHVQTTQGVWAIAWDGVSTFLHTEGNAGNHIWRSTDDGVTWTDLGVKSIATQAVSLVWTGSLFVTASNSGAHFATSPDGDTWTARSFTGASNYRSFAVGPGRVMGFHRSGSATAAVSTDGGLTWSSFTMPASIQCSTAYSAIYANGLFVAVDIIANKSYYSADGISWSSSSMPGGGSLWTSVFWVGDKFVAQSSFGTNSLCTSPDGVTWTVRSTINHAPFIVI